MKTEDGAPWVLVLECSDCLLSPCSEVLSVFRLPKGGVHATRFA